MRMSKILLTCRPSPGRPPGTWRWVTHRTCQTLFRKSLPLAFSCPYFFVVSEATARDRAHVSAVSVGRTAGVPSPAPRTGGGAGRRACEPRPHAHAPLGAVLCRLQREVKGERKVSRAGALRPSPHLLLRASGDSSLGPAALSPGPSIAPWALPLAHISPASIRSSRPARHPGNGGGNGVTQICGRSPFPTPSLGVSPSSPLNPTPSPDLGPL